MPVRPHSSIYLGFYIFWLGFSLCVTFFPFSPSVCMFACIHFFHLLLPNHLPPPLTSAPFWLFQFTGSCPAHNAGESLRKMFTCAQIFTTCQLEGAWKIFFLLHSDTAQWKPPRLTLKCHHQPEGLHWPRTRDLLFSAYWLPYGETANYSIPQIRLMEK